MEKKEEDKNSPLSIIHTTFVLNNSPHIFSQYGLALSFFFLSLLFAVSSRHLRLCLCVRSFIFRHINAAHSQTVQYTNIPYRCARLYSSQILFREILLDSAYNIYFSKLNLTEYMKYFKIKRRKYKKLLKRFVQKNFIYFVRSLI